MKCCVSVTQISVLPGIYLIPDAFLLKESNYFVSIIIGRGQINFPSAETGQQLCKLNIAETLRVPLQTSYR